MRHSRNYAVAVPDDRLGGIAGRRRCERTPWLSRRRGSRRPRRIPTTALPERTVHLEKQAARACGLAAQVKIDLLFFQRNHAGPIGRRSARMLVHELLEEIARPILRHEFQFVLGVVPALIMKAS